MLIVYHIKSIFIYCLSQIPDIYCPQSRVSTAELPANFARLSCDGNFYIYYQSMYYCFRFVSWLTCNIATLLLLFGLIFKDEFSTNSRVKTGTAKKINDINMPIVD